MIRDPMDVFLGDFSQESDITFEWEGDDDEPLSKSLRGIFDNAFVDSTLGETVLDTTSPRITCKHSDAVDVPREAVTTIGGVVYSVTQIQPDGTGFAIIMLAIE